MAFNSDKRMFALGRMKAGKRNKTELEYEACLQKKMEAGEILWFAFESITLKLADDTRYTPDYFVMRKDGELEAHEVKGFWTDDARVKFKVAADKFPFKFIAVRRIAKKNGGGFETIDNR